MNIDYSKDAVKSIKSIDSRTKQRIKNAIESIPSGDIKPLKGTDACFRLRVGMYRIIFEYKEKDLIYIIKIATRGDAYKGGLL